MSFAGLAVLLVAAALLFDSEPLWVAAAALALLAAGSVLWVGAAARRTTVIRTLEAHRVQEGADVACALTVRATIPLPGGVVDDGLGGVPLPLPAGARSVRVRTGIRADRRGRRLLSAPNVVLTDPFSVFGSTVRSATGDDELLVLPRIEPVLGGPADASATGLGRARSARPARHGAPPLPELDGIGPLRDGTPSSRIYWPSVARGSELLERRLAAGDGRPVIVLDPREPASDDDLDTAIRAAASLAFDLAGRGGCRLALPDRSAPVVLDRTRRSWSSAHDRLAVVGPQMAPNAGALAGRHGPVILVCARRPERASELARRSAAVRVLVVAGAVPGRTASFTVAGCRGYPMAGVRSPRRTVAGSAR